MVDYGNDVVYYSYLYSNFQQQAIGHVDAAMTYDAVDFVDVDYFLLLVKVADEAWKIEVLIQMVGAASAESSASVAADGVVAAVAVYDVEIVKIAIAIANVGIVAFVDVACFFAVCIAKLFVWQLLVLSRHERRLRWHVLVILY